MTLGRFVPSLACLMLFALFAGLWFSGAQAAYQELLTLWGVDPSGLPFIDIDGPLSALDCARRGLDVIADNPCDLLRRPYNYSPVLLNFDWLPLGGADRLWFGFVLDLLFFASIALLPAPAARGEIWLRIAAAISTMVVFAAERVNTDVAIFLLVMLAYRLLLRSSAALRGLGYGVVCLAAAVKYYPVIVLALAVRERLRLAVAVIVASVAGLGLLIWHYAVPWRRTLDMVPHNSPFGDTFGAVDLLVGLHDLARGEAGNAATAAAIGVAAMLVAAVLAIAFLVWWWRAADIPAALLRLEEPSRLALLVGALLVGGCFLTLQNVSYRGVFLLFILPGLGALRRDGQAGVTSAIAAAASWVAVLLMWDGGLRSWLHILTTGHSPLPAYLGMHTLDTFSGVVLWVLREFAWWAFAAVLLSLLLGFAVGTGRSIGLALGRVLRKRLWRKMPGEGLR